MRVAHITTVHNWRDPRIFHKQLSTLCSAGFDCRLLVRRNDFAIRDGITLVPLPSRYGRYARLRSLPTVYRIARDQRALVYHIHDPELIPVAWAIKRFTGASVIYDMHEDYRWHGPVVGRIIRATERWCFSWVDHIILAEDGYRSIVDRVSAPATVVKNYHKPMESPNAKFTEVANLHPLRLLYTGVVAKERGSDQMLQLAAALQDRKVEAALTIAGICHSKRHRREVRRQLDEVDASWIGGGQYVPRESMVPHYRSAHVGLALFEPHGNYIHSLPTKFYEYLHYGLPILCSDFPLWRRFVRKHKCGAVVPAGDIQSAADVLERWQSHPDEYVAYSSAARQAAKHYRWEPMGRRLLRIYDDLISAST